MNQNERILAILNARWPDGITAYDALDQIGCMRLAARIRDLREQGHVIKTERVTRHGKTWAVYKLYIPENEMRALWGDR